MTFSINGSDVGQAIEIASWAATGLLIAVTLLIVMLLVRPPRHVRERRKAEKMGVPAPPMDAEDNEHLLRTVDRMEARLEVLERALADKTGRPAIGGRRDDEILTPAEDGRELEGKE